MFINGYKYIFIWFIYSLFSNVIIFFSVFLKYLFPKNILIDFINKEIFFPLSSFVSYTTRSLNLYDFLLKIVPGRRVINKNDDIYSTTDARIKYLWLDLDHFDSSLRLKKNKRIFSWLQSGLIHFNLIKMNFGGYIKNNISPFRAVEYDMPLFFSSGYIWNKNVNPRFFSYFDIFVNNMIYRPTIVNIFSNFRKYFFGKARYYNAKGIMFKNEYSASALAPFYV